MGTGWCLEYKHFEKEVAIHVEKTINMKILRDIYNCNENLMEYLRKEDGITQNTAEHIMLSYDFQAGTYTKSYYANPDEKRRFLQRLTDIIVSKRISGSLLEAGTGEGTSLVPLLQSLEQGGKSAFHEIYAFDISWSRIKAAKKFGHEQGIDNIQFFTGDLFHIPLADNHFDLVFTVHAIEPNGGNERAILQELYRVCKKYMILMEPCYEFAGEEARRRMEKHGYITKLWETAKELGYHIETYELYGTTSNPLNPTGLMIIRKDGLGEEQFALEKNVTPPATYRCPISKKPLKSYGDSFYCPDSMLAYPVIQGIPCLLPGNAVVATKYESKFDFKK